MRKVILMLMFFIMSLSAWATDFLIEDGDDYGVQFIDSEMSLIGTLYSSVAWGDYDNDDDLDLAVCGQRKSKIYKNNGYGILTDISAVLPETAITGAFAWGDYDNDGDLDFAINGADFTRIYKNEGNDTFIDIGIELPSLCYFIHGSQLGNGSIAWGDYDNDGDLDIVISGARGFVKIYRNNGDETFTDVEATGFIGIARSSVAWGDYDHDGDLDLAICGSIGASSFATPITKIYRNNDDNTFTDIKAGLPGELNATIAWGDYDNDGDLDLAVNNLSIYKNNGDDTFINIGVKIIGGAHASLAWGDYDNDGDLDIAASGSYKTIFYRNNGNDAFTVINDGLTGVSMGDIAWGDYDNDGDLDLVVSGYIVGSTITKIYKNLEADSIGNSNPNSFAFPPTLLPQEPHSNILKWNSGYDEETPTDGLYYHIRVGTVSGEDDIVSGVYGSPLLGNYLRPKVTNEQLGIRLNNLPPNGVTYYWSVKTIDTGLQASEWSDEGTFVSINNIPIADAGEDATVSADEDCEAVVILDGSGSSDADGDELSYSWYYEGELFAEGVEVETELALGTYIFTLIVNDGTEDSEGDEVVITVVDNTAPDFSVVMDPSELWPPNNNMVQVEPVFTVSDNCSDDITIELVEIICDECDQDDYLTDDGVYLRAERSGEGDGRVYILTYSAVDEAGNETLARASVFVPHDMGQHYGGRPGDRNNDLFLDYSDLAILRMQMAAGVLSGSELFEALLLLAESWLD